MNIEPQTWINAQVAFALVTIGIVLASFFLRDAVREKSSKKK